jgi:hypothetical protein
MKRLILTFLALLLLIEEWLWSELTALGNRLSVWLHLLKFDNWLIMASPEIAMAAFILPVLLLAPVQIAALWLAANGQLATGIALLTLAKLFATLLISHMFMLTRDKLLTFPWFASVYTTITHWLEWAHERIRATEAYKRVLQLKHLAAARLDEWWRTG